MLKLLMISVFELMSLLKKEKVIEISLRLKKKKKKEDKV